MPGQVHRILDSLAQETPAVPGKMLKEILGTWENAFARPDDYYQLPDEVKEEIESKKVDDGIKKSFGSMFRYLEKKSARERDAVPTPQAGIFPPPAQVSFRIKAWWRAEWNIKRLLIDDY